MKILLTIFFIFFDVQAFACKVSAPISLNLFTDLDEKSAYYFKDNFVLDKPLVFNVTGCEQTASGKKALMIAVGTEQYGREDTKRSISFTGEFSDDQCTITPSPVPIMPFSEKFEYFKRKNDYLKNCVEVQVINTGLRPLAYSATQKGCTINKISNQEAIFQGGFCFFKPTADSNYQVSLRIKKECRERQGLQNILQGPQELTGAINFYVAGDDSGASPDLTSLKSTPMTISVNPTATLMPIAFNNGVISPLWPGQWIFPKIYPAKLAITSSGDSYKLQTPLLVSHQCPSRCVEGICSGPCDYALPIAGEFILKEILNGKEIYLSSWYDGGVVPANWQGLIWGQGQLIDKSFLQKNHRYKIEFNLIDPKIDFNIFKNKMKKKLGNLNARLGRIAAGETIGEIGSVPEIPVGPGIPNIGGINTSIGNSVGDLDAALMTLNSRLSLGNWPPLYDESCSSDLSNCKRTPSYVLKYELTFDILDDNNGSSVDIGNFIIKRRTPFEADYDDTPMELPQVVCE